MVEKYKDSFVLVSGLGDIVEVADTHYGYNKAIDMAELFAIFPEISAGLTVSLGQEFIDQKQKELMARFEKKGYGSLEQLKSDL